MTEAQWVAAMKDLEEDLRRGLGTATVRDLVFSFSGDERTGAVEMYLPDAKDGGRDRERVVCEGGQWLIGSSP